MRPFSVLRMRIAGFGVSPRAGICNRLIACAMRNAAQIPIRRKFRNPVSLHIPFLSP